VGLRGGTDMVAKRKISLPLPCHKSNPGRPARELVTKLTKLQ